MFWILGRLSLLILNGSNQLKPLLGGCPGQIEKKHYPPSIDPTSKALCQ